MARKVALIAGASGIVGLNLANRLAEDSSWDIYGLARRPVDLKDVRPIAVDLFDPTAVQNAVKDIPVTHAFFCTWSKQTTEAENCEVNGRMFQNFLDAVENSPALEHVSLVTGNKHYLGPFEDYGTRPVETPFREEQPRVPGLNFYYTQEDVLFERSAKRGFGWNVHRPHTVIGYALGNAMNMGVTLGVYATICRETGRPFAFPGSPELYEGINSITDARQLAKQIEWAATSTAARNQTFNVNNDDVFRWKWMWTQLAEFFGLEPAPYPGHATPLAIQMKDAAPTWDTIVSKYSLQPYKLEDLASWWHTDGDLGLRFECFNDMSKSRNLGFSAYQETRTSFFDLFRTLQKENIIP